MDVKFINLSNNFSITRLNSLESIFSDFSYQTDRRFKEIDKSFDRQGAMTATMMNMASSTSALKSLNRIELAASFQCNEKAVAIGDQRLVNENLSLSVGGTFTDDEGFNLK